MPFIEPHSTICVRLRCYWNEDVISESASAFLQRRENQLFLTTNWHVLSGRNTYTGQTLDPNTRIPTHLEVIFHSSELGLSREPIILPLYNQNEDPLWLMHGEGQKFDIAALRIDAEAHNLVHHRTLQDLTQHEIRVNVGMKVSLLGYPLGLSMQGAFPIWKSGWLATEHMVERDDGAPVYLVDSATREGMSGSPVFLIADGPYQHSDGSTRLDGHRATKFLGIYSGRYGNSIEEEL